MRKLWVLFIPWMLTACVTSVEGIDAAALSEETGFLVMDVEVTFDGEKVDPNALNLCSLTGFTTDSVNALRDLKVTARDTFHFRIAKTAKPGKYSFDAINCRQHKVLWAKDREKRIDPPLVVDVRPGMITYPGTIVADWESEGFGALDLLNGGGAWADDKGSLVLKRENRSAQIKRMLEEKNPAWLEKFKFVTTTFEPNARLVQ